MSFFRRLSTEGVVADGVYVAAEMFEEGWVLDADGVCVFDGVLEESHAHNSAPNIITMLAYLSNNFIVGMVIESEQEGCRRSSRLGRSYLRRRRKLSSRVEWLCPR